MESLAHEAAQGRGGQGKGYHRVLNKLMEWQWKVWRIERVDGMAMESLAHEAAQGRGGQGKGCHCVLNKLMEWQWEVQAAQGRECRGRRGWVADTG